MSTQPAVQCPTCQKIASYEPAVEGTVGPCPQCGEPVWFSKLAQGFQSEQSPPVAESIAGLNTSPPRLPTPQLATWLLVISIGAFLAFDNYRIRKSIRQLDANLQRIHQEQQPAPSRSPTAQTALGRAEMNQAQLDAIVAEVNAIKTVIDAKLAQFSSRSNEGKSQLDRLTNNVNGLITDFEELEFGVATIQQTLSEIIENEARLEAELLAR